ncbi:MAG: hypothetical protein PHU46_12425 [Rhodocyclaceae bacterium]|nr:hypothetical protein [Rhodocyclaceae bacterium]
MGATRDKEGRTGLEFRTTFFGRNLGRTLFLQLTIAAVPVSAWAYPTELLNSTTPDFFQHQKDIFPADGYTSDGGVCFATSFVDELSSLSKQYSDTRLYSANADPGKWLKDMVSNIQSVLSTASGSAMRSPGYDARSYYQSYLESVDAGRWGVYGSANASTYFDYFASKLAEKDGVLIYLEANGAKDAGGNNKFWWGWHVLAGVGYKSADDMNSFIFADPDNTKYPNPADPADPRYQGFCTTVTGGCKPTGQYLAADGPPTGGNVGGYNDSYYQGFTVDANGVVLDGIYAGAKVTYIYDITPVPEIDPASGTSALTLLLGSLGLLANRRRGTHVV